MTSVFWKSSPKDVFFIILFFTTFSSIGISISWACTNNITWIKSLRGGGLLLNVLLSMSNFKKNSKGQFELLVSCIFFENFTSCGLKYFTPNQREQHFQFLALKVKADPPSNLYLGACAFQFGISNVHFNEQVLRLELYKLTFTTLLRTSLLLFVWLIFLITSSTFFFSINAASQRKK